MDLIAAYEDSDSDGAAVETAKRSRAHVEGDEVNDAEESIESLLAAKIKRVKPLEENLAGNDSVSSNLCAVCKLEQPKYKCPRCVQLTCSLACVKAHKHSGCDGIRPRSTFLPTKQMGINTLLNDYYFLEQAQMEVVGLSLRDPKVNKTNQIHKQKARLSGRSNALYRLCSSRDPPVSITFAPTGMDLSKRNTSCINKRRNIIRWRVEWNFVQANKTLVHQRLDENFTWKQGLEYFLCQNGSPAVNERYAQALAQRTNGQTTTQAGKRAKRKQQQQKQAETTTAAKPPGDDCNQNGATRTNSGDTGLAGQQSSEQNSSDPGECKDKSLRAADPAGSAGATLPSDSPANLLKPGEAAPTQQQIVTPESSVSGEQSTSATPASASSPSSSPSKRSNNSNNQHNVDQLSFVLKPLEPHEQTLARFQLKSYADAFHSPGKTQGNPTTADQKAEDNRNSNDIRLFLQVPNLPANAPKFYHLSMEDTIAASLAGKALVEFPRIKVVLSSHALEHLYPRFEGGATSSVDSEDSSSEEDASVGPGEVASS